MLSNKDSIDEICCLFVLCKLQVYYGADNVLKLYLLLDIRIQFATKQSLFFMNQVAQWLSFIAEVTPVQPLYNKIQKESYCY